MNADDRTFAALADPTRRRVLETLLERPRAVHDIAAAFSISRPAISRHLRVLSEAGLTRATRRGRLNVYEVDTANLVAVRGWLDRFWGGKLAALKRLAETDT